MERKKSRVKDNVGLYNESCDKKSAGTKGYMAYFVLRKCPKSLKEDLEKKKTVVFRKRVSAKTTVFSVFKSVNLVSKSDDTLTARRRRARKSQGVVLCSYNIN